MEQSKTIRLSYKHIHLLRNMLHLYSGRMRQQGFPTEARKAKRLCSSLPSRLPYDLDLYPHEWAIVSRALRADGPKPEPGTIASAAQALYFKLRMAGFSRAARYDEEGERRALPPVE